MWLNYLIWSYRQRSTINHQFPHFEFGYVARQAPAYCTHIRFARHLAEASVGTIRLGSDLAWYNFYLNINIKKGMSPPNFLYAAAIDAVKNSQANIPFNLDWRLIWQDPEQFIKDLSAVGNIEIELNSVVEHAIEQYQNSCYLPKLTGEFRQSDLYKHWHQAIIDTATDSALTMSQRAEQAHSITEQLYWPG